MPAFDQFTRDHLEQLSACPWCRSTEASYMFDEQGWSYWQCGNCSLIYLNPRLKETCIGLIYDDETYHAATNLAYNKRLGEKQLDLLRGFGAPLGRDSNVFEDGAGMGAFVAACRAAGIDANGSDLGQDAIEKAKHNFNVDLHFGTLGTVGIEDGSLDVLAGFNLLSHLYEPWAYADQVRRLLKPGGYWFVRTGDRAGVMSRVGRGHWSAPEHVFHYTGRVLNDIAQESGLTYVRSVPAFDSSFPNLLAGYGNSGSGLSHRVARKIHSYSNIAWTIARLPKEDKYVLFRRMD